MLLRLVALLPCLIVTVSLSGCRTESKPMPAVPIGIEELAGEWKANRETTLAKYKGRLLEIAGTVVLATNDTSVLLPMVRLRGEAADKKTSASVKCLFVVKEAPQIDRLCEGQEVTVRGQLIDSESAEAALLNCSLAETGASPALTSSLAELIQEYKSNKEKMADKYNAHWLIMEGFVAEVERPKMQKFDLAKNSPPVEVEDEHCYRYIFKSDEKTVQVSAVCCSFYNQTLLKKLAAVAVGQKIKVQGRCDKTVWRDKKRIELTQCVLLEE